MELEGSSTLCRRVASCPCSDSLNRRVGVGKQQQLQNWKIKIIFLCRRKLYEPLHPGWLTGEYNWISSLVGELSAAGLFICLLVWLPVWNRNRSINMYTFKQWAQHGRQLRKKLIFYQTSSGCCAKILFRMK